MKYFLAAWNEVCHDAIVLDWIKGYKIPFTEKVFQFSAPKNSNWSPREFDQVLVQINKLLKKGAIQTCQEERGQFVSKIFLIPKPDGSYRLILNLKKLNKFIETIHFKLEDIRMVRDLVRRDCFMATLDLKDAYYLVSIEKSYRKYLRFEFDGKLYEFTCLPFGLNTAPYVFTKLLKPVFSYLRHRGFISVVYLDDVWIFGDTNQDCLANLSETRRILEKLGFIINETKSQLSPSKECKFLGFIVDSLNMRIKLPDKKRLNVKLLIKKFKKSEFCTIRDFSSLVGVLGSCCPAVRYGWVYVKDLERVKIKALRANNEDYEARLKLPALVDEDFSWWEDNIDSTFNPIKTPDFSIEIFSDASLTGWVPARVIKVRRGFGLKRKKCFQSTTLN